MCGTIPSVQPNAATTLVRRPRERPAATVYRTPVPGETTIRSVVSRKATLTLSTRRRDVEVVGTRGTRAMRALRRLDRDGPPSVGRRVGEQERVGPDVPGG